MIKNQRGLLSLANRLCRNHATAEDLVQDTLIRAWEKRHAFQVRTDFGGWCAKILLNKYRDQLRRLRCRPQEVPMDRAPAIAESGVEGDIADEYATQESDKAARLLFTEVVAELPFSHITKAVMTCKLFGEMRNAEIATTLGIKEQAVRSAIFRARALLKKRLMHG